MRLQAQVNHSGWRIVAWPTFVNNEIVSVTQLTPDDLGNYIVYNRLSLSNKFVFVVRY